MIFFSWEASVEGARNTRNVSEPFSLASDPVVMARSRHNRKRTSMGCSEACKCIQVRWSLALSPVTIRELAFARLLTRHRPHDVK